MATLPHSPPAPQRRHDERFCGSLEDLRDTACEYCGATHAVLVDRRGRIITLEVKPGETLADVISRRIGAPLDGMAFEINGRRVHNITSASVSTGDLVREVLPETRDDAQRLAERFQVNISLSPYGVSQVSISRPSAPAPAPLPAVSVPKGLPQRAPSELFVAAGPRGTPPAGVAPTALGAGAAPNPGASPVTRPPAWRWDAEVAPLSPGPGVAPRRALGSRRGSEASSSERAGSSGSHHPVVIGFGDAARVMGSDNDDRPGRMLACSPQMVGV